MDIGRAQNGSRSEVKKVENTLSSKAPEKRNFSTTISQGGTKDRNKYEGMPLHTAFTNACLDYFKGKVWHTPDESLARDLVEHDPDKTIVVPSEHGKAFDGGNEDIPSATAFLHACLESLKENFWHTPPDEGLSKTPIVDNKFTNEPASYENKNSGISDEKIDNIIPKENKDFSEKPLASDPHENSSNSFQDSSDTVSVNSASAGILGSEKEIEKVFQNEVARPTEISTSQKLSETEIKQKMKEMEDILSKEIKKAYKSIEEASKEIIEIKDKNEELKEENKRIEAHNRELQVRNTMKTQELREYKKEGVEDFEQSNIVQSDLSNTANEETKMEINTEISSSKELLEKTFEQKMENAETFLSEEIEKLYEVMKETLSKISKIGKEKKEIKDKMEELEKENRQIKGNREKLQNRYKSLVEELKELRSEYEKKEVKGSQQSDIAQPNFNDTNNRIESEINTDSDQIDSFQKADSERSNVSLEDKSRSFEELGEQLVSKLGKGRSINEPLMNIKNLMEKANKYKLDIKEIYKDNCRKTDELVNELIEIYSTNKTAYGMQNSTFGKINKQLEKTQQDLSSIIFEKYSKVNGKHREKRIASIDKLLRDFWNECSEGINKVTDKYRNYKKFLDAQTTFVLNGHLEQENKNGERNNLLREMKSIEESLATQVELLRKPLEGNQINGVEREKLEKFIKASEQFIDKTKSLFESGLPNLDSSSSDQSQTQKKTPDNSTGIPPSDSGYNTLGKNSKNISSVEDGISAASTDAAKTTTVVSSSGTDNSINDDAKGMITSNQSSKEKNTNLLDEEQYRTYEKSAGPVVVPKGFPTLEKYLEEKVIPPLPEDTVITSSYNANNLINDNAKEKGKNANYTENVSETTNGVEFSTPLDTKQDGVPNSSQVLDQSQGLANDYSGLGSGAALYGREYSRDEGKVEDTSQSNTKQPNNEGSNKPLPSLPIDASATSSSRSFYGYQNLGTGAALYGREVWDEVSIVPSKSNIKQNEAYSESASGSNDHREVMNTKQPNLERTQSHVINEGSSNSSEKALPSLPVTEGGSLQAPENYSSWDQYLLRKSAAKLPNDTDLNANNNSDTPPGSDEKYRLYKDKPIIVNVDNDEKSSVPPKNEEKELPPPPAPPKEDINPTTSETKKTNNGVNEASHNFDTSNTEKALSELPKELPPLPSEVEKELTTLESRAKKAKERVDKGEKRSKKAFTRTKEALLEYERANVEGKLKLKKNWKKKVFQIYEKMAVSERLNKENLDLLANSAQWRYLDKKRSVKGLNQSETEEFSELILERRNYLQKEASNEHKKAEEARKDAERSKERYDRVIKKLITPSENNTTNTITWKDNTILYYSELKLKKANRAIEKHGKMEQKMIERYKMIIDKNIEEKLINSKKDINSNKSKKGSNINQMGENKYSDYAGTKLRSESSDQIFNSNNFYNIFGSLNPSQKTLSSFIEVGTSTQQYTFNPSEESIMQSQYEELSDKIFSNPRSPDDTNSSEAIPDSDGTITKESRKKSRNIFALRSVAQITDLFKEKDNMDSIDAQHQLRLRKLKGDYQNTYVTNNSSSVTIEKKLPDTPNAFYAQNDDNNLSDLNEQRKQTQNDDDGIQKQNRDSNTAEKSSNLEITEVISEKPGGAIDTARKLYEDIDKHDEYIEERKKNGIIYMPSEKNNLKKLLQQSSSEYEESSKKFYQYFDEEGKLVVDKLSQAFEELDNCTKDLRKKFEKFKAYSQLGLEIHSSKKIVDKLNGFGKWEEKDETFIEEECKGLMDKYNKLKKEIELDWSKAKNDITIEEAEKFSKNLENNSKELFNIFDKIAVNVQKNRSKPESGLTLDNFKERYGFSIGPEEISEDSSKESFKESFDKRFKTHWTKMFEKYKGEMQETHPDIKTYEDYIKALDKKAESLARTEGDKVYTRCPVEFQGVKVLDAILKSGRFKTLFETGMSGGTNDPSARAESEKRYLGYPIDVHPTLRPIYVSIADGPELKEEVDGAVDQYGHVAFRFKDQISKRMTIAGGDSLNNEKVNCVPYEKPDARMFELVDTGSNPLSWDSLEASGRFREGQIHGGASLYDVDAVFFTRPKEVSRRELEAFAKSFKKLGIKVLGKQEGSYSKEDSYSEM